MFNVQEVVECLDEPEQSFSFKAIIDPFFFLKKKS